MAKRKSTIPQYKRRRPRSFVRRLAGWVAKIIAAFFLISILWVLAYRFVNPPITVAMIGDVFAGRGLHKDWMPIRQIDRDMVRAAIAAEDSKFCSHHGFDFEAIEDAMKRNASGGRIRGGSTGGCGDAAIWRRGRMNQSSTMTARPIGTASHESSTMIWENMILRPCS